MNFWKRGTIKQCESKVFRDGFMEGSTIIYLSAQMRNMRGDMSKKEFARKMNISVGRIANLENPDYRNMNLRTLLRIAKKLDVALVCKFVDYDTFFNMRDYSEEAMNPSQYQKGMFNEA